MDEYFYFSNGLVEFSLLKTLAPKEYAGFENPIFCDFDSDNLRFVVDYWRNNGARSCTEQQMYDLVRLRMDHFEAKVTQQKLKVGNRIFLTTKETLCKMPYFDAVFRVDGDLTANLDRDPIYFERLLSHCRHPLQHPLHSLDVSVQEMSFFGLCPKYLKLWNEETSGVNDSHRKPFDKENDGYKNSMSRALNSLPEITLFINNFQRYLEFNSNTIFVEESEREKGLNDVGDSVYFTSESIDCSLIDVMSNFHVVCESDVEILSLNQLFEHVYATLYACNDGEECFSSNLLRQNIVNRPVISRHAKIIHAWQPIGPGRNDIYQNVQNRHLFDYHDDLEDVSKQRTADETSQLGKDVTVSMSWLQQKCMSELKQQSSFLSHKRGNRYYVTVPLQMFFSSGVQLNSQFFNLRERFHFQLRFDGVKNSKLRLMLNAYQLSEEEVEATLSRQNEFLIDIQYTLFSEICDNGVFQKTWTAGKPYSIRYFLLQVRDKDSGERLSCNVKGKFTIGGDVMPFNIHTNQVAQKDVFGLREYNPYIYLIPYCIRASSQPTGCLFVTTGMQITIDVECDVDDVEIDCWMTCYRVLQQNFVEQIDFQDVKSTHKNEIGFACDEDVKQEKRWKPNVHGRYENTLASLADFQPQPVQHASSVVFQPQLILHASSLQPHPVPEYLFASNENVGELNEDVGEPGENDGEGNVDYFHDFRNRFNKQQ